MGVEITESASPDDSTATQDAVDVSASLKSTESSSGHEGEKFDLLSVVRDAVKPKDGDVASPASQESQNGQPPVDASAPKTDSVEPDNENFSDVPFHKHPRFKEVVSERNRYREGARQYEQVQSFLKTNGLGPEDAADALLIWADMKTNPQEAWKRLKPIVQKLLVDAGEVIPGDLKQKVAQGQMSPDAALEMARLRARAGNLEQSSARQAEQAQQAQVAAQQRAISAAAETWEMGVRRSDPDFAAKMDDLKREIVFLQREKGMPNTPEKVREQLDEAYKAVNARVASFRPKQAKTPVTGGRAASGSTTAAPGSMLDLVRMGRSAG